jgi:hypothetical protein
MRLWEYSELYVSYGKAEEVDGSELKNADVKGM